MLPLMEQNVKLNNLESRVTPLVLNWYLQNPSTPDCFTGSDYPRIALLTLTTK